MQSNQTLLAAIALRKCVTATYNRTTVTLAPHILYTRHGELFVDAVNLAREGGQPREIKLGVFKLTGLSDLELSEQPFEPDASFEPLAEKYAGETVFAVETNLVG